jgi:membrane-associated protein
MSRLLDSLLTLDGVAVYLIIALVVLAEDALFIGFVLPGESAAVLGGVTASRGHVSLTAMCFVVVAAAIVGDTVGYEIGTRYGARLLSVRVLRRRSERVDAARATLARRGGLAVFLGRFVALFRAVMPFLSGSIHMPYRRFVAYNAAGGLVWGVAAVLVGYLAGNSYATIERTYGRGAAVIVAAVVIVGLIVWRIRQRSRSRPPTAADGGEPGHLGSADK